MARWKAYGRLSIRLNWTFFRRLLTSRPIRRNVYILAVFAGGSTSLHSNFTWTGKPEAYWMTLKRENFVLFTFARHVTTRIVLTILKINFWNILDNRIHVSCLLRRYLLLSKEITHLRNSFVSLFASYQNLVLLTPNVRACWAALATDTGVASMMQEEAIASSCFWGTSKWIALDLWLVKERDSVCGLVESMPPKSLNSTIAES